MTDYPVIFFNQTAPSAVRVMSMVNVYHSIRRAPSRSVLELSIISHAFVGGPILVNSRVRPSTLSGQRDPTDKDGRAQSDFTTDMGESGPALDQFKNAFDPKASIRIWGCDVAHATRGVVRQAYELPTRNKTALGRRLLNPPVPDDLPIDVQVDATFGTEITEHPCFPPQGTPFPKPWKDVVKCVARAVERTYMFRAAAATGITTIGALPGTGAEDEKKELGIMKICRSKSPPPPPLECNDGFFRYLKFYETFLQIRSEPERNFGIFDAAAVRAVQNVINS
jgi:hypothetical protein